MKRYLGFTAAFLIAVACIASKVHDHAKANQRWDTVDACLGIISLCGVLAAIMLGSALLIE